MSKQIAIPNTITPKPTKSEIIEAMVAVRLKQQGEEYNAAIERSEMLSKKANELLEKHARKALRSADLEISMGYLSRASGRLSSVRAGVPLESLPPDVEAAVKAFHLFEIPKMKDASAIRREIKARMLSGGRSSDRVRALINSPDSRKAIEDTLAAIGMGAKTIEAMEAANA